MPVGSLAFLMVVCVSGFSIALVKRQYVLESHVDYSNAVQQSSKLLRGNAKQQAHDEFVCQVQKQLKMRRTVNASSPSGWDTVLLRARYDE